MILKGPTTFAALIAPLQLNDKAVGIICIEQEEKTRFWGLADKTLLHSLGDLYSLAVETSERQRVEKKLREAKNAAEAATKAKSEFLANMSHEIRTPMNGILGITDLLAETELSSDQTEYVEMISGSASSLMSIINDFLDFSKIEADVPRYLSGDSGRLRQILINLMGNSVKFIENVGGILVRVQKVDENEEQVKLEFLVSDTGIGIPEEKQGLIFESFQQADSSTTRKYGGTGLGLSISSQLATLMGGKMWVASQPGMGTAFHFSVWLEKVDPEKLI